MLNFFELGDDSRRGVPDRRTVFKVRANKRRIEFVKSRGTRVTIEKAI